MSRLVLLFASLVFFVPWAAGTTLLQLDLDDLTRGSPTVVHARIVASRAEWNENRTSIYTIYTVQPMEYLKGDLGASFELHELGGVLEGVGMSVAGVPHFTVGQEAVLFVWTDPHGKHQVTGFEQGNLTVQSDPATGEKMVSRGIRLESARTPSVLDWSAPKTSRSLPQLLIQIRSSVVKTRESGVAR